jgi:hypothetical protein
VGGDLTSVAVVRVVLDPEVGEEQRRDDRQGGDRQVAEPESTQGSQGRETSLRDPEKLSEADSTAKPAEVRNSD